jgi:hypothetical protein
MHYRCPGADLDPLEILAGYQIIERGTDADIVEVTSWNGVVSTSEHSCPGAPSNISGDTAYLAREVECVEDSGMIAVLRVDEKTLDDTGDLLFLTRIVEVKSSPDDDEPCLLIFDAEADRTSR